jgi:N-acetylglutamate synthase/N-acetylornithine aminotransferase
VGGVPIVAHGSGLSGAETAARAALAGDEVQVDIDLGLGVGQAKVIASDLSPDYVEFNSGLTT